MMAEIIPFEPDAGNAAEGREFLLYIILVRAIAAFTSETLMK